MAGRSKRPRTANALASRISRRTIAATVRQIAQRFKPHRIILFGSHARGDARPDSDLDLFIEMDLTEPRLELTRQIRRSFTTYPCAMDLVIYTPEETRKWAQAKASLAATVLREGKILYERPQVH